MNYAEAFKSLRLAYKLTQAEFAALLQVSKPTIQKLEAGDYPPSEKMAARLAELFRSEKFRAELRPRVEGGDLRSVKAAFGDLLDVVDAEVDTFSSSSETVEPIPKINLADAYADLKKIQDIVMSQQDTIRDLSSSTKNFSESSKTMAESNKILAESTKNFSESNKNLSVSIRNLSEGRAFQVRTC